MPFGEKLRRSPAGAVADVVGVHGDDQLGELEELRYVVRVPVADILPDALGDIDAGALALDDDEWDAVYHDEDIRAGITAVFAFDRELLRDLPDVLFRVFPVDEAQVEGLFTSVVELFLIGAPEQQGVIDDLGGGQQAVLQRDVEIFDRLADCAVGEGGDFIPVGEVLGAQKAPQLILENDLAQMFALDFRLRGRNIDIPHGAQQIDRPILRLRPLVEYRVVKHDCSVTCKYVHNNHKCS